MDDQPIIAINIKTLVAEEALFSPKAFVLVFRYKLSVLRVLGICATVGAGLYLATT